MKALILTLILLLPIFLLAQTNIVKYPGNPVLDVGPEGSWDDAIVNNPSVIFDGANYKMWYGGNDGTNFRIGYATSPDGVNWTKADSVNPVLDIGIADSWDDENVASPCVLYDGNIYKMWYHGYDGTIEVIGYATSDDGITWTKHASPVLELGSVGSWDDVYIWGPKVLSVDSEFIMWYSGYDGSEIKGGCAKSTDGIVWTKENQNPVLISTKHWERSFLMTGPVIYINNVFRMWYCAGLTAEQLQTGYATSEDGINWTKADDVNPVLNSGPAGDWDYNFSSVRSVYFDGETYHYWYDSYKYMTSGAIGYATSDTTTAVGITKEIAIPEVYELSQNYPNPFNPSTTIKYQIPSNVKGETRNVKLIVYDVLGREVTTLVNQQQKAGYYEVQFTSNNVQLTSGVYFYKILAGDFVETKKMLLLR